MNPRSKATPRALTRAAMTILLAVASSALGCRDRCDDLADAWRDCCDEAPSGATCTVPDTSDESTDDCSAILDRFECPY
jgi:hypothetical protein